VPIAPLKLGEKNEKVGQVTSMGVKLLPHLGGLGGKKGGWEGGVVRTNVVKSRSHHLQEALWPYKHPYT
jgi:hypothetical protein